MHTHTAEKKHNVDTNTEYIVCSRAFRSYGTSDLTKTTMTITTRDYEKKKQFGTTARVGKRETIRMQ